MSTSELETLQASFAEAVIDGDQHFEAAVQQANGQGLPAAQRVAIYAHAYRARLIDTLADSFAHTQTYVGEAAFHELALAYVEAHTPHAYSLRWYGQSFPAWLMQTHPQDPDVAELAELDWALRAAFDSADAAPLAPADLAGLTPEDWARVGFVLHPAFTLLEQRHNTVALWHALDQQQAPPAAQALAQASALLVWRRGHKPHFRTLADDEAAALRSLHVGASFAQVCEELAAVSEHAAAQAGRWLRRWLDEELLVGVVA